MFTMYTSNMFIFIIAFTCHNHFQITDCPSLLLIALINSVTKSSLRKRGLVSSSSL